MSEGGGRNRVGLVDTVGSISWTLSHSPSSCEGWSLAIKLLTCLVLSVYLPVVLSPACPSQCIVASLYFLFTTSITFREDNISDSSSTNLPCRFLIYLYNIYILYASPGSMLLCFLVLPHSCDPLSMNFLETSSSQTFSLHMYLYSRWLRQTKNPFRLT